MTPASGLWTESLRWLQLQHSAVEGMGTGERVTCGSIALCPGSGFPFPLFISPPPLCPSDQPTSFLWSQAGCSCPCRPLGPRFHPRRTSLEFLSKTDRQPLKATQGWCRVFLLLQCRAVVRDTGSGVTPSKRPNLSEPRFPYLDNGGSERVANIFPALSLCPALS